MPKTTSIIIAGTGSGVGKTTVTLGIMGALKRRGLIVQPFKAGPDYIDPGYHGALLGRPSYNLDTWMMGAEGVRATYLKSSAGADAAVVEGVMGLFDGRSTRGRGGGSGKDEEGSTAHLAKVLKAPVLLVVNGARMARSAGAVVSGFEGFDPEVKVKWVVFNNVGSARHYDILRRSLKPASKVKVLGYLPRDPALITPERHLGLAQQADIRAAHWKRFLRRLGSAVESGIDVDALVRSLSSGKKGPRVSPRRAAVKASSSGRVRIGVAKDRAFSFYYQENLDILSELGALLVPVSPMSRARLPRGLKGLYLGGGYPELYGGPLEANGSFREDVKSAAAAGMPIYAECGGLMYLGRAIRDLSGTSFKMAGVFPWSVRMTGKRKALGYREVVAVKGSPMLKGGARVRGHEFHYSEMIKSPPASVKRAFSFVVGPNGGGGDNGAGDGYIYKNTLASYTHLHFASNTDFARGFVDMCRGYGGG